MANEMPDSPASDPFSAQPKDTIFTFFDHAFNISLLERLVAHGEIDLTHRILPLEGVVKASRLHTYRFTQDMNGTWTMKQVQDEGVVNVTLSHVLSMTEVRKAVPVLLAGMPQSAKEEKSNLVLIDGFHRTVRHIIDGDETISVALISRPEDLCRFHCHKINSKAFDALGQPVDPDRIEVRYYWAGR